MVAASRRSSLAVVCGLLKALAPVAEHWRQARPQQLWHTGLAATAGGIFPDRGLNPCPLSWQVNFYPVYHQGNPQLLIFKEGDNSVQITEFL